MKRREFIALIGVGASTWPFAAWAQQPAPPVIGFLHSASAEPNANFVKAFRKGLFDVGFIESQNVTIGLNADDLRKGLAKVSGIASSCPLAASRRPGAQHNVIRLARTAMFLPHFVGDTSTSNSTESRRAKK